MAESVLYTENLSVNIDLITGVWRHEYGTVAAPASEDEALAQLQANGVIQYTCPLIAKSSTAFDTEAETITLALEQARVWRDDPLANNPLFWKIRPYKQTPRRFLVLGGTFVEIARPGADNLDEDGLRRGNLVMYLHIAPPENNLPRFAGVLTAAVDQGGYKSMVGSPTYPPGLGDGSDLTVLGGTLQIVGDGTRPGRIAMLEIVNNDTTSANALNNIWVGMKRTSRTDAEAAGDFDPNLTGLVADVGSPYANGSGGSGENAYKTFDLTYNSGAWGTCFYAEYPNNTDYTLHLGNFLLLMRYKITAVAGSGDKPIRFRTSYGFGTTGTRVYNEAVYISQPAVMSTWGILPVGFFRYPHIAAKYNTGYNHSLTEINVLLESNLLDSGDTATVQFNRFIAIPRPYLYVSGANLHTARRLVYQCHPNDTQEMNVYTSAAGLPGTPTVPYLEVSADISPDFYLPVEGATLVIAAARSLSNMDSADVVDMGAVIYDRYMSWKG